MTGLLQLAVALLAVLGADAGSVVPAVDWGSVLDRYGWPTAVVVIGGGLLLRGTLRTGREVVALEKQWADRLAALAVDYQARLAYADARRKEDHDARLVAEQRLDGILPAVSAVTAIVQQVKEELIRASK